MSEPAGHPFTVPNWLLLIGLTAGALTLALYGSGAVIAATTRSMPSWEPLCIEQLNNRDTAIAKVRTELRKAPWRLRGLHEAVDAGTPGARASLKEERAEIERLKQEGADLIGPAISTSAAKQLVFFTLTIAALLAAAIAAGAHGRRAGIRPVEKPRDVIEPLAWVTLANFTVAAIVTCTESVDPAKTGFDWASYCIARIPFWVTHASVLPLCVVAAVTGATGWYLTGTRHVPAPDPMRPHWGVKRYVRFLEIWSFVTVVLVGLVAGGWIYTLNPTRTDRTNLFLGFGALGVAATLVLRFARNAMLLRNRCEHIIENSARRATLPPDPTEGMLGNQWWQLPAVFAAATSAAWKVLEASGLGALLNLH